MLRGEIDKDWRIPKVVTPGYDFAGIVYALPEGDEATPTLGFSLGDEVFGVNWGNGRHDDPAVAEGPIAGTLSEFCMVPLNRLSRKPLGLSFDEAASIAMAGCTAYQCVSECAQLVHEQGVGQRVLILGGDTPIGTIAIQLAKKAGAW